MNTEQEVIVYEIDNGSGEGIVICNSEESAMRSINDLLAWIFDEGLREGMVGEQDSITIRVGKMPRAEFEALEPADWF
jgi:hypothetical protein